MLGGQDFQFEGSQCLHLSFTILSHYTTETYHIYIFRWTNPSSLVTDSVISPFTALEPILLFKWPKRTVAIDSDYYFGPENLEREASQTPWNSISSMINLSHIHHSPELIHCPSCFWIVVEMGEIEKSLSLQESTEHYSLSGISVSGKLKIYWYGRRNRLEYLFWNNLGFLKQVKRIYLFAVETSWLSKILLDSINDHGSERVVLVNLSTDSLQVRFLKILVGLIRIFSYVTVLYQYVDGVQRISTNVR